MSRSKSGFTLVELLVVLVILGILGALLVPQIRRATSNPHYASCRSNLKSLWGAMLNYGAQYGKPNGDLPDDTGSAFYLRLQKTPKPMIDRFEPFICPQTDETPRPGRCSYRGPAYAIREMNATDPVGADKEGNHGKGEGGTVMTKQGDIRDYDEDEPIWIRARVTTKE